VAVSFIVVLLSVRLEVRRPARARLIAGEHLARAYEFLDTVGVRMFGNPTESFQEMAMGGRADVTFETPTPGLAASPASRSEAREQLAAASGCEESLYL
jgi:hypothetical protein